MAKTPNPDVMNAYKWELYNLQNDWTQNFNLAETNPQKLRELQELFMVEASKNQVFPLDNTISTRLINPRPSLTAGRTEFTYAGTIYGIPHGDAPNILNSPYANKVKS